MSRRQAEIEQHVASAADKHDTLAVGTFADGEAFFHERGRHNDARPLPRWNERPPTIVELATHRAALPNAPRGLGRTELAFGLGLRRDDPGTTSTGRGTANSYARQRR